MSDTSTLEPGDPHGEYPINEQSSPDFHVGGVKRTLPPAEQLEQLVSYLDATYPRPDFRPPWINPEADADLPDRYVALLPDRITHAALLMLGSAVDHTMPGVAFAECIRTEELAEPAELAGAVIFHPSSPSGRWAVSLHSGGWWRGSGVALEQQWRPEVAAAAELSGTTIIDVDHPLAPEHSVQEISAAVARAIEYARAQGASSVTAWGYSSGAALAALQAPLVDALLLTYPDLDSLAKLPDEIRGAEQVPAASVWPERTLVQIATADEIATAPADTGSAEVAEYMSQHRISTPEVARQRIRDTAEFLASV